MIVLFVGSMGSGKTLSMVKTAYDYYKQGYKIVSNMKLNFPHRYITSQDVQEFAINQEQLYNTVVLIDEIHIFMDSRRSASKKNLLTSYFLTQTRKQKVKLLATTQHRHQVDRRLRDNTEAFVDCEIKEIPFGDNEKVLIVVNHFNTRKSYEKMVFIGNKYFHLYDTEEIIFDKSASE